MFAKPSKCCPSVTPLSFMVHAIGFAWYCYGIYNDRFLYIMPVFNEYGGRFRFLTYLTAYLIWIATGFATFVDFIQLTTSRLENKQLMPETCSLLISIRDEFMSFWVFTMGWFVSVMFWGIAAVDLDGIHPDEIERISPLLGWFNHFLHTVPIFYVVILALCVNYQHSPMARIFFNVTMLGSGYVTWMWYLSHVNGTWPYDFMDKLSQTEFIVFIAFAHLVLFAVYLIGRKIAATAWTGKKRHEYLKNKNL